MTIGLRRRLRRWARRARIDGIALWFAAQDPRTPWYAKAIAGAVAAYLLSPIDLIPDFVPLLGYLDDVLIVYAAIWLTTKLIPSELMVDFRRRADAVKLLPRSYMGAAAVCAIWTAAAIGLLYLARISLW